EDPVGQVLAQRVLLVLLVARAMRAQLQRPHAFEYRPLHFLPGELDSERDEGAVARHEAKVAAGAQLDGNGAALAVAAVDPHHGRKASRARRVAFFVDRLEVGGERQAERIGALEEPTVLRGPAPLPCLLRIGPRFGEPGQRVLLLLLLLRVFLGDSDVGRDQQQDEERRDEPRPLPPRARSVKKGARDRCRRRSARWRPPPRRGPHRSAPDPPPAAIRRSAKAGARPRSPPSPPARPASTPPPPRPRSCRGAGRSGP